jgi:hypothetical protein
MMESGSPPRHWYHHNVRPLDDEFQTRYADLHDFHKILLLTDVPLDTDTPSVLLPMRVVVAFKDFSFLSTLDFLQSGVNHFFSDIVEHFFSQI